MAVTFTVLHHVALDRVGEVLPLRQGEGAVVASVRTLASVETPLTTEGSSEGALCLSANDDTVVLRRVAGWDGGVTVGGVPLEESLTLDRARLTRGVVIEVAEQAVLLLHEELPAPAPGAAALREMGLLGRSRTMERVRQSVVNVAPTELSVTLVGEAGSGTTVVAHAIHRLSARRDGPCVVIDLASRSETEALASLSIDPPEPADPRPSAFARAEGGVLVLRGVDEASERVQAAILHGVGGGSRAPEGRVRLVPRGGPHGVRVLSTSRHDLHGLAREGLFHRRLAQALSGFALHVPPLRARMEDFGVLLISCLRTELAAVGVAGRLAPGAGAAPWLPVALVARLARLPWPGNVAQLRTLARQLAITYAHAAQVTPGPWLDRLNALYRGPRPAHVRAAGTRSEPVHAHVDVKEAMAASRWEVTAAARRLGLSRPAMYDLIARHPDLSMPNDHGEAALREALEAAGGDVARTADGLCLSRRGLKRRLSALGIPWR